MSFAPENLAQVRARIAAAEQRAGREPGSVTLLPVTKTFGVEILRQAVGYGLLRFGENKVQEIKAKAEPLADCGISWVVIGHLQTNKAKEVARLADEIQSLDRLDLAQALQKRLEIEDRDMDALVQVKTSSEPSKSGMAPEDVALFLRQLATEAPRLHVRGLMTLAVNSADASQVRACFRRLKTLRDALLPVLPAGMSLDRLSMGMSGDFEMAIEEGSTEVRIGSLLFGGRDYGPAAGSDVAPATAP